MSKVICKICLREFGMLTATHLSKSHGMTVAEYLDAFPGAQLLSDESLFKKRQNISASKKGLPPPNKGRPMSTETKQKLSESAKLRRPRQGNKPSQETKDKISSKLKGKALTQAHRAALRAAIAKNKTEGSYVPPVPRGTKLSDEHRQASVNILISANIRKSEKSKLEKIQKIESASMQVLECSGDIWQIKCLKCGTDMTYHKQIFDKCRRDVNVCPICYPRDSGTSAEETDLYNFVREVYSGEIRRNCRSSLPGYEIDIYLPELKVGIEYNGLYWHSCNANSIREEHHIYNKFRYALKNDITIINIFSDEWLNCKEIVKSRIRNRLKSSDIKKIYARKCNVRSISNQEKNTFLSANHIQGSDISKYRYGAFYNDELVAVMTFSKTTFAKGGNGSGMELNRFCTKSGYNVVGIASKLFSTFLKEHSPNSVISYSDNRWGTGNLYKKLGFRYVQNTPPSYYYTNDYRTRTHRSVFMKHKLKKFSSYAEDKTEKQIMKEEGWDWIYDCGSTKWMWEAPTPTSC